MSRSQESIWVWLFWGFGTFLVLELGTFLLAGLALSKTLGELAGPFLAYAIPAVILLPLVWLLRKREKPGADPKRLARTWGLSMILFLVAAISATFYAGVELRLMDFSDAIGGFIVSLLIGVPLAYFTAYNMTLPVIISRAAKRQGDSGPK